MLKLDQVSFSAAINAVGWQQALQILQQMHRGGESCICLRRIAIHSDSPIGAVLVCCELGETPQQNLALVICILKSVVVPSTLLGIEQHL